MFNGIDLVMKTDIKTLQMKWYKSFEFTFTISPVEILSCNASLLTLQLDFLKFIYLCIHF